MQTVELDLGEVLDSYNQDPLSCLLPERPGDGTKRDSSGTILNK